MLRADTSLPAGPSGFGLWGADGAAAPVRAALWICAFGAFTVYLAIATVATVVFPPAAVVFIAPLGLIAVAAIPQGRATPRRLALMALIAGTALLPVWPIYIHIKLGPLPIITPARLLLYAASAMWAIDMVSSPLRRAQFIISIQRGGPVSWLALGMLSIALLSVPMAQGRIASGTETIRQLIIWYIPFCVAVTYVRRDCDLYRLMIALLAGSVLGSFIAIIETASGQLLAGVLAPLIGSGAEWLELVQQQKIRDGVFRAQATHTHPLSLGEFIALMAPFALLLSFKAKTLTMRAMWISALVILFGGAIATNSRGALLAIAISVIVSLVILLRRAMENRLGSRIAPLAGLIMLGLVAGSPLGAVVAQKVVSGAGKTSAANSTQSRIDQIEKAWPKILKRPVGGYGTGRGARVLGYWGRTLTIDNYYLSLALDYGFPGPAVFFALLIATIATAHRRSRDGPAKGPGGLSVDQNEVLYVGMIAAFLAFAVTRSITSLGSNVALIYLILGAFAGAAVSRQRHRRSGRRRYKSRVLF